MDSDIRLDIVGTFQTLTSCLFFSHICRCGNTSSNTRTPTDVLRHIILHISTLWKYTTSFCVRKCRIPNMSTLSTNCIHFRNCIPTQPSVAARVRTPSFQLIPTRILTAARIHSLAVAYSFLCRCARVHRQKSSYGSGWQSEMNAVLKRSGGTIKKHPVLGHGLH